MEQHRREFIRSKSGRKSAFADRCATVVDPARQATVLMPALRTSCRVNNLVLAARSIGSRAARLAKSCARAPSRSAEPRNAHLDWVSLNTSCKRRSP